MTNFKIGEALSRALGRGVQVRIWLGGRPCRSVPDQERFILNRLVNEGAEVYFQAVTKSEIGSP